MARPLVVFGVTGQQGASVATTVLKDAELSNVYSVRGVTRDASKPEARALESQGVEILRGNTDDRASIRQVFQGAHTVFAMTVSIYERGGAEREIAQGKAIADEAVAAGVQFLIYSVVPSPSKLTKGKWPVASVSLGCGGTQVHRFRDVRESAS